MTKTIKSGLLLAVMAFTIINNCTTVGHANSMKSELSIAPDKHRSIQRPIEMTHEIKEQNYQAMAQGSVLWIPGVFDSMLGVFDAVGGVLGGVLRGVAEAGSSVPYVGSSIESGVGSAAANVGNIGPLLNNFKVVGLANEAESKIVYREKFDGFFRTGVVAQISINVPWIIFKDYKVTVVGKPVINKYLGVISDARLAKIQLMAAKAGCTTCADIDKAAPAGK